MKCVILAGGLGTRLSEETHLKPKPMVDVGGVPILWHIMKTYAHHGVKDFIVCCGYKGDVIKDYFANYLMRNSDVRFDLGTREQEILDDRTEDWTVTLVDTGKDSMTGGRIGRIGDFLDDDEPFCMTYGDGVGDVDITALIKFHKSHGREATVTAALPPGRFGAMDIVGEGEVKAFQEKPRGDTGQINAGYFVLEKSVLSRITSDATIWEQEPLKGLAADGQLMAFKHDGFWQPMDTLRDKQNLDKRVANGDAPWMVWL